MAYVDYRALEIRQQLSFQIKATPAIIRPQIVIHHVVETSRVAQLAHGYRVDRQGQHIVHRLELQLSLVVVNYHALQLREGG